MTILNKVHVVTPLRCAAVVVALPALVFAFALTSCTGQGAEPKSAAPETLTASEAGGEYLEVVCPVNAAWDDADVELDRVRIALGRGESDTSALADALQHVADASEEAAERLDSERHVWPKSAQEPVKAVRATLISDQKQAAKVAKLPAEETVSYAWEGQEEAATAALEARTALELPADPASACEQWDAQKVTPSEKPTPTPSE